MVSLLRESRFAHCGEWVGAALHPVSVKVDRVVVTHHETNESLITFLASVEQDAYRLALAACQDANDALDLVQDAMLTLVNKYRNHPESEWAPLFHRILQNRIRDWFRRQTVQHTLLRWTGLGDTREQIEQIESPASNNPEAHAGTEDALATIEAAIRQLPYRQQQVFLLRSWKEWSVLETANAMSISPSSVKTHHSRALVALRTLLSEQTLSDLEIIHE